MRDWEIFKSPAKGNQLPNTVFAIRTQTQGQESVTRMIEGPIQPPHDLSHRYHPATTVGLPRLLHTTFRDEYPIATSDFEDPAN